jgi:hypothetical protein
MKHCILAILIVAVLLGGANPKAFAQSKPGTTQWLCEECTSPESARRDICSAFLLGVAGVMEILGNTYENPPNGVSKNFLSPYVPVAICSVGRLTGADVRQVFVKRADENPTRSTSDMPQSAMAALQATWPCKRSR